MTYRQPHLADLQDIIDWSNRIVSRSDLPNLVRRLVSQTNDSIIKLDMRGDEEVTFEGYDGRVQAARGTPLVPQGDSVWEMGTSADYKKKAQSDYEKRSQDPRGVAREETTFVFVTPRRWADSAKWVAEKQADAIWKDVVVFDAADLYAAMESAPAVHIQFSESVHKPANSVGGLSDWWLSYTASTQGLLTPEIVLAGRADQAAALLRTLRDFETGHTWISAASVDDVLAFVASTLLRAPADQAPDYLDRALVVYEPGALRYLNSTSKLLILLPFEQSLVREADLVTSHHVILHAPKGGNASIVLPQIPAALASTVLEELGVDYSTRESLALAAYRSIPNFKSKIIGVPTAGSQTLAVSLASTPITRRAWLLGSWDAARSGDVEVFQRLTGNSEGAYLQLAPMSEAADPIFTKVGSTWKVISPTTHLDAIAASLSSEDLSSFEEAIQSVLGAVDPSLKISAAERWKASLFGPARLHSSDLRLGIATTLAAFGSSERGRANNPGPALRGWAELYVRALFDRANADESGELWLSLTDVLPQLAEAAPDVFLDSLETAITHQGVLVNRLFTDDGDQLTSSSPHIYFVWALETLAWSPDYLPAAMDLLARLAEADPGGRLSNRPFDVLVNTFRPWMPQTSANTEEQLTVLKAIVRRYR